MQSRLEVVMLVMEAGVTVTEPGGLTAVPSVVLTLLVPKDVPEPVMLTGVVPLVKVIAVMVPALVIGLVKSIRNREAPCVPNPFAADGVVMTSDVAPLEAPEAIVVVYWTLP